jgi:ligand-binding sensor domain-containing protein
MTLFQLVRLNGFVFLFALLCSSCQGQNVEPFPVKATKIHKDSIALRAETLPEYRNSVHDTDYQGNQISGVIRTVFQDSKVNLWFGTQNGLARYDKSGLVYFSLVDFNGKEVTVYKILEDKIGNIWIGYGGGIAKYDGNYFTMYHQKDILTLNGLWSMMMDSKGKLWIGTTQGVYTFDGESLTPFEIPEGKINPSLGISTAKMIHSIIEDKSGNIWFATNGGVYIYNENTLKNISEKDGLQTNFISDIIERKDGTFLISNSKGIFNIKGDSIINITENQLGTEDSIGCVFEDNKGVIWFSVNKRDIYSYDGKTFLNIKNTVNNFSPFPFSIYQDNKNRLWFVGFKGAYRYENETFINVNRNGPW